MFVRPWHVIVLLAAGVSRTDPDTARRVAETEKKVAAFEDRLKSVENDLSTATWRLNALDDEEGVIDPTSKGYAFLKTRLGTFLVSCDDVKPYGDGYKLVLRIGNPHAITLRGFKLTGTPRPSAFFAHAAKASGV